MRSRFAARGALLLAVLVSLPVFAAFHLMRVVEVFPGTPAAPNAQYVVIQMYASSQNFVTGHDISVFNAQGTEVGNFVFADDVPNGSNQDKILIATPEAVAFFNLQADLEMTPAIISSGGKVCFAGTLDCVAWGAYSGPDTGVGTPYKAATGLATGKAAKRRLDIGGSPSTLEASDDTNNSANDFIEGLPAPRNNLRVNGTIPASTCGNGLLEGLEQCDDNNTNNGDTCSSTCLVTPAPPTISIADVSISEGNAGTKQATFTVTLAPTSAAPVTFDIGTDYGTAAPGSDFVGQSLLGQSIAAGQSSSNFLVTINGDAEVEGNESFTVNLTNVVGAAVADSQARGTITNDDNGVLSIADASVAEGNSGTSTMSFIVSLSSPMPTSVSFNIATSNGTATAGSDYVARSQLPRVLDAGRTRTVFEVAVNGDTAVEVSETFNVTVSGVVGATLGDGAAIGTIINDGDSAVTPISQIQGNSVVSPLQGQAVRAEGVVTALTESGFFLQSGPNEEDGDPSTSEGVFVATRDSSATVSDRVVVHGRVAELAFGGDPKNPGATQLIAETVGIIHHQHRLPKPLSLDAGNAGPDQGIAGLERFEGMRVRAASLRVVGPVDADSRSQVVVDKVARPFLEPGLDPLDRSQRRAGVSAPVSDGNPERLEIDSLGQLGSRPLLVDAGDVIEELSGVLDQADGMYRILPDANGAPFISSGAIPKPVSRPSPSQATFGSLNLPDVSGGLASPDRLIRAAKLSKLICDFARQPDVLVLFGTDGTPDVRCGSDPGYRVEAVGATGGSFLVSDKEVRAGLPKVEVLSISPVGTEAMFRRTDGRLERLHDQPPVLLRVRINRAGAPSVPLTLVASRFAPLPIQPAVSGSVARRNEAMVALREKRLAQAEFLARLVNARQSENLVVFGDFDAPHFSDGHADLLGVVAGRTVARNRVLAYRASPVHPPLTNLTAQLPPAERYTSIRDGNAQVLSHVLANAKLLASYPDLHVEIARVNADFGVDNGDDVEVPLRIGDTDPQVLFLDLE